MPSGRTIDLGSLIPEPSGMVLQGFELASENGLSSASGSTSGSRRGPKLSGALARHWSSPIRVQGQDPGLRRSAGSTGRRAEFSRSATIQPTTKRL